MKAKATDLDNNPATVSSRDQAEAAMAMVAALTVQLEGEVNDQNARLVLAHQNDSAIEDLRVRIARYREGLAQWAKDNRQEFKETKTLELRQGWISFKPGGRSIGILKNWTEELVLARLRKLKQFKGYVRIKESIDRQTLLRDSKPGIGRLLDEKDLKGVGLEILQEETFYVEPKLERVKRPVSVEAVA